MLISVHESAVPEMNQSNVPLLEVASLEAGYGDVLIL
ncbi:MAG: hypothetical protein RLZZ485_893, partial [Actinomycetota bacterium]